MSSLQLKIPKKIDAGINNRYASVMIKCNLLDEIRYSANIYKVVTPIDIATMAIQATMPRVLTVLLANSR